MSIIKLLLCSFVGALILLGAACSVKTYLDVQDIKKILEKMRRENKNGKDAEKCDV